MAARALSSGCEHHQGVIDPWQWHIRASRDCDRVTGGSARAGAPARHHHPARPMTRRERVILSRAERAFEGHDVVLPSARTWPGSSGLGWVPPWPGAWPVTTRASPRDEPRDDPRDCTDGLLNSANARADGRAPAGVPEKVCSLVRREGQSPRLPRCRRGQALRQQPRIPLSACSKGFPARSGPVPTPCNRPCRRPARPSTQS